MESKIGKMLLFVLLASGSMAVRAADGADRVRAIKEQEDAAIRLTVIAGICTSITIWAEIADVNHTGWQYYVAGASSVISVSCGMGGLYKLARPIIVRPTSNDIPLQIEAERNTAARTYNNKIRTLRRLKTLTTITKKASTLLSVASGAHLMLESLAEPEKYWPTDNKKHNLLLGAASLAVGAAGMAAGYGLERYTKRLASRLPAA